MAPNFNLGGWIHNFAVTDSQTHKGGYTIYKITSVVFPRSIPQALTCITVWKRFHDVKRLHRELSRRHKSFHLPGHLPEPTDSTYFKRFDSGVIKRRKDYILQLLDYAAQHPVLYKCHAFAQFFCDDGQSPAESPLHRLHVQQNDAMIAPISTMLLGGQGKGFSAIVEICDQNDLLYDPHGGGALNLIDPERDNALEEKQCQKDDNINHSEIAAERNSINNNENVEEIVSVDQQINYNNNIMKEQTIIKVEKTNEKDCNRFLTPMASIESDDGDYIYEAALEFSHAVQAEVDLEYKEAHVHYKRGVEILLNGSKDDCNDERKYIAKAKVLKYLARSDDIYDKFLRDGGIEGQTTVLKKNCQLSIDVTERSHATVCADSPGIYLERPWNHLAKYKVLKIIKDSVMQVQCITEPQKPIYIMKGIEKPSRNTPTQTVFLPQQVSYMVDLLAFFQSEQKIFLLLKQAEGGRLFDYVKCYKFKVEKRTHYSVLFPEINKKNEIKDLEIAIEATNMPAEETTDITERNNESIEPSETTNIEDLVRCSQQLLQTVSNTLNEVENSLGQSGLVEITKRPTLKVKNTKIPEASLKQWASELAVAINSLHSKGIILGDLHNENLLLGAKGQLLLTYFYQNEGVGDDNSVHKSVSPLAIAGHFVAPEGPLSKKSDWWSYGVILYELLIDLSFKAAHPGHIDLYGCVQYPENIDISENARNLLDGLLQQETEERFNYLQIQEHAFFEGINWTKVRENGINV